jgi:D-alanine transaminase
LAKKSGANKEFSMWVFFNGSLVEDDKVKLSPFDRGFQFSDGVYEVIRYYPKKFFKLDLHIERLKRSLHEIEIPVPAFNDLEFLLMELISKNNLTDELSTAYIQITRGYQFPRRHNYSGKIDPTFFISVEKLPWKKNELTDGIKVGIAEDIRWQRCDIKSTMLLATTLLNHQAVGRGLSELILHRNGKITEGTHTNICFVKDNSVITPPLSNLILPGITRKVVSDLCRLLNIEFIEREIDLNELPNFNEASILGTTKEITPIIEIEGIKTNINKPGSVCRKLQLEYSKLYNG